MDNAFSLFLRCFVGDHNYAYNLGDIAHYVVLHHKLMEHWLNLYSKHIFVLDYERMVYEKQQTDMSKLANFVEVNKANGVASSANSKKKVPGLLLW